MRLDDGRVFRRHFNHIRRDGACETDVSCAEGPSEVAHSVPREPRGPVILPRPANSVEPRGPVILPRPARCVAAEPVSVATEPLAGAQTAAAPAQDAAPADVDSAEADMSTDEQLRDTVEPENADDQRAGERREVEPLPGAPRRSKRPRAPVKRLNLYIH